MTREELEDLVRRRCEQARVAMEQASKKPNVARLSNKMRTEWATRQRAAQTFSDACVIAQSILGEKIPLREAEERIKSLFLSVFMGHI